MHEHRHISKGAQASELASERAMNNKSYRKYLSTNEHNNMVDMCVSRRQI